MAEAKNKKKVFDGRFEVQEIVGRGSQSVVYRAKTTHPPGSEVALKVLVQAKKPKKGAPSLHEKLRKEALAMVSARHPYVVRIDDFHSVDQLCYLALEYAPFGDLRKYTQAKPLNPTSAIEFLKQMAEALSFIHDVAILHRDIKPDNILVINEKEVRLGDFGVALLPGDNDSISELQSGIGTMDYMAPEVLEGVAYTPLSDLYALGVSFYEVIAGKHPFQGISMAKQLDARKPGGYPAISSLVPKIPKKLAQIIEKLMAYEETNRFSSAAELLDVLNEPLEKNLTSEDGETTFDANTQKDSPVSAENILKRLEGIRDDRARKGKEKASSDSAVAAKSANQKEEEKEKKDQPKRTLPHEAAQPKPAFVNPYKQQSTSDSSNKRLIITALSIALFIGLLRLGFGGGTTGEIQESVGIQTEQTQEQTDQQVIETVEQNIAQSQEVNSQVTTIDTPQAIESSSFPQLKAGLYHGLLRNFYPGVSVPITILSYAQRKELVFILGIPGWSPQAISTEGTKVGDTLQVASNGMVFKFSADQTDNDSLIGVFQNIITGIQGEWVVKLLGAAK